MSGPSKKDHHPILAIETAGTCGSVALVLPTHTIAEYSLDSGSTHSRRLLSGIDWIMKEADLTWPDIQAIAVSLGPGSFTGLRIGLSTAKGLAMASGKQMIGVPTLDALACQVPFTQYQICPLVDARKQEIYAAFFRYAGQERIQRLNDYRAWSAEMLAAEISEPTLFLGDGAQLYREPLKDRLGDKALFGDPHIFFARAAAVGQIAHGMLANEEFVDPASVTPIYIRKSDAELNFGKPK